MTSPRITGSQIAFDARIAASQSGGSSDGRSTSGSGMSGRSMVGSGSEMSGRKRIRKPMPMTATAAWAMPLATWRAAYSPGRSRSSRSRRAGALPGAGLSRTGPSGATSSARVMVAPCHGITTRTSTPSPATTVSAPFGFASATGSPSMSSRTRSLVSVDSGTTSIRRPSCSIEKAVGTGLSIGRPDGAHNRPRSIPPASKVYSAWRITGRLAAPASSSRRTGVS